MDCCNGESYGGADRYPLGDPLKFFQLLQDVYSHERVVMTDKGATFHNIDNLVFQGGGVKGVAYLGVVKELSRDIHKHVLPNVKRVAGTSAGSMVALYISLGMTSAEIEVLLIKSFSDYLDDDIEIMVEAEPSKRHKYKIKHILGRALELLGEIYRSHKSIKPDLGWAKRQLNELIYNGLDHHKLLKNLPMKYQMGLMLPGIISFQFGLGAKILEGLDNLAPILKDTEVNCHKYAQRKDVPALKGKVLHIAIAELLGVTFFSTVLNKIKKQKRYNHLVIDQASMFAGTLVKSQLIYEPIRRHIKLKTKWYREEFVEDNEEYGWVKFETSNPPFTIDKATFGNLDRCFDEKKIKCFKSLYVTAFNSRTLQTEVFSVEHTPNVIVADAVRASMGIPVFFTTTPIREDNKARESLYKVKEKNKEEKEEEENEQKELNLTAAEIEGIKKEEQEEKDGAESIMMEDETENGLSEPKKIIAKREKIRYMDGGVFDNFAMWIFDNLGYCLDNPKWNKEIYRDPKKNKEVPNLPYLCKKIHIENPRTLGFKLYDGTIKDQVEKTKKKDVKTKIDTSTNLAKTLLGAMAGEYEENVYSRGNHYKRTVLVNNNGVSTFAFQALPEVQDGLIESGREAIRDFLRKAIEDDE